MTQETMLAALERRRRRLDRLMVVVPYATLGGSLLLDFVAGLLGFIPGQQPFEVAALLTLVAAGWVTWWMPMHPQWEQRRGLMLVFFIGVLILIGALVWASPLFGFFGWTGYLFAGYALAGRWRLVGAGFVAVFGAFAQLGGYGVLSSTGSEIAYGVVLLFNLVLAVGMTHRATVDNDQADQRVKMIDELHQSNTKLAEALQENAGLHAQLLVQAREAGILDERQRMAGEIHDVLAQGLTGIVTQLEAADAAEARPADRRRHLDAAKRLARDSLTEARRSVQALRPQTLDASALPEAIGEVVDGWSSINGVNAELITTGSPRPLLPEIETTLLRTAQEALANVARHAEAGRVALTLSYMEDVVTLDVRDDGSGFDLSAPVTPSAEGGYGLSTMRDRLSRIAGTLAVESEPGGGTALSACVPAIPIGAVA
jgi:signal transduction histidine kinase